MKADLKHHLVEMFKAYKKDMISYQEVAEAYNVDPVDVNGLLLIGERYFLEIGR